MIFETLGYIIAWDTFYILFPEKTEDKFIIYISNKCRQKQSLILQDKIQHIFNRLVKIQTLETKSKLATFILLSSQVKNGNFQLISDSF